MSFVVFQGKKNRQAAMHLCPRCLIPCPDTHTETCLYIIVIYHYGVMWEWQQNSKVYLFFYLVTLVVIFDTALVWKHNCNRLLCLKMVKGGLFFLIHCIDISSTPVTLLLWKTSWVRMKMYYLSCVVLPDTLTGYWEGVTGRDSLPTTNPLSLSYTQVQLGCYVVEWDWLPQYNKKVVIRIQLSEGQLKALITVTEK